MTIEKLCWLLGKAVAAFGERTVGEVRLEEIASRRIARLARLPLRRNPGAAAGARAGGPLGMMTSTRRSSVWTNQLDAVTANLSPRYRPMVIVAAATGLRPAEWLAVEWRDLHLEARLVYVHRSFMKGRLKCPKTEASRRAVSLQTIALQALRWKLNGRASTVVT